MREFSILLTCVGSVLAVRTGCGGRGGSTVAGPVSPTNIDAQAAPRQPTEELDGNELPVKIGALGRESAVVSIDVGIRSGAVIWRATSVCGLKVKPPRCGPTAGCGAVSRRGGGSGMM